MITEYNKFTNKLNFEVGKEFEYEELPIRTKYDIDVQFDENDYETDPTDYVYKCVLLQPEDIEEYLHNHFGEYNIQEVLDTKFMKDLIKDIKKNGLNFPPVGVEGNHRALAHWYLKKPLPYLDMIKKSDI